jgi:hypothetical protein
MKISLLRIPQLVEEGMAEYHRLANSNELIDLVNDWQQLPTPHREIPSDNYGPSDGRTQHPWEIVLPENKNGIQTDQPSGQLHIYKNGLG